jgi:hypothetical protein
MIVRYTTEAQFFMSYASSLQEALRRYILTHFAAEGVNGDLVLSVPGFPQLPFADELDAIERWEKMNCREWNIRELQTKSWSAEYAEQFSGEEAGDEDNYADICRKQFGASFDLPTDAFTWHMKKGVLVSFYEKDGSRALQTGVVTHRFMISWSTFPKVSTWEDGSDEILKQMKLRCGF